jgi:hypothetical protein
MADFPPLGGAGSGPTEGPAPGWWQASDGNWYPPEQQPGVAAPGYGAPAGYGYGYATAGPQTTNGMAIASLVLSLLSFACAITWILGIIFGHIALGQISRTGEGGRGLAIAGLVIGYLWLVGIVAFVALVVATANESNIDFNFEGLLP